MTERMIRLRRAGLWCIAAALILTLCYIFGNSLQSQGESSDRSESLAQQVQPILDPQQKVEPARFHHLLRKAAHGLEYALLGAELLVGAILLDRRLLSRQIPTALLILLASAVTDEFIQSFTGRGDQIQDIVLDFCGGVTGMLLSAAVCLLLYAFLFRRNAPPKPGKSAKKNG